MTAQGDGTHSHPQWRPYDGWRAGFGEQDRSSRLVGATVARTVVGRCWRLHLRAPYGLGRRVRARDRAVGAVHRIHEYRARVRAKADDETLVGATPLGPRGRRIRHLRADVLSRAFAGLRGHLGLVVADDHGR